MLVAQILKSALQHRRPHLHCPYSAGIGTAALGAVGVCAFPLIVIITAFSESVRQRRCTAVSRFNAEKAKKQLPEAECVMNTSFTMLCVSAVIASMAARPSLCRVLCWPCSARPGDALALCPVRICMIYLHRHAALDDRRRA